MECINARTAFLWRTGAPLLFRKSRPSKCKRYAPPFLSIESQSPSIPNTSRSSRNISPLQRKLPLALTFARCAAVPVVTTVYLAPVFPYQRLLSASIFAFSSITDFLDGYLARRWDVCTPLGAFLDPVADKLIVSAALVCIVSRLPVPGLALIAATILVREIFVSALREWMASRGARNTVKVGNIGKVKTAAQMGAVMLLLAAKEPQGRLAITGTTVLAVSALLAVFSAVKYLQAAIPTLIGGDRDGG